MRWLFVAVIFLNLMYLGMRLPQKEVVSAPVLPNALEATTFPESLELLPDSGVGSATTGDVPAARLDCPALGPLMDEAGAQSILSALRGRDFEASLERVVAQPSPAYWVYLPALEGRQQALRKLREMQAAGIESFVVAAGADANAISLGTFTVRDSALGVQARLRAAGYPVQVRDQGRASAAYWVVVNGPGTQGFYEFVPEPYQDRKLLARRPCSTR